jgi:hypothetical protein
LVEAFQAARQAGPESATLVVRPRAAGFAPTDVWLDGQRWDGSPPLSGPHLVVVTADGAPARSTLVFLDSQTPTVLEPFLAPVGTPEERAALTELALTSAEEPARLAALTTLANRSAARVVLIESESGLTLYTEGRPLRALSPPKKDGTSVGRAVLVALQVRRGPDEEEPEAAASPALVWGLVGVGAAVVVATAGLATWAVWPFPVPAPPPKPVVLACCDTSPANLSGP